MRTFVRWHRVAPLVGVIAVALLIGLGLAPGIRTAKAQDATTVTIADFAFSPGQLTITEGTTVTWVNNDSAPHTATGDGGEFDTGQIDPGGSASITFDTAGTYSYFCSIHPSMTATIVVQAAGSDDGDDDDNGGPELPNTGAGITTGGPLGGSVLAGITVLASLILGLSGLALRRRSA
jgi:plastocyanin